MCTPVGVAMSHRTRGLSPDSHAMPSPNKPIKERRSSIGCWSPDENEETEAHVGHAIPRLTQTESRLSA